MRTFARMLVWGIPSFALAGALSSAAMRAVVAPSDDAAAAPNGLATSPAPTRAPLERGTRSRLELKRDSRPVLALAKGESALRLQVANHFEGPAIIKYAVELADDHGNEIEGPVVSPVRSVSPRDSVPVEVQLPRDLGDGFYLVRVTVVGRAAGQSADDLIEIGLAALDGEVLLLSDEEWFEYSDANGGFQR